ncbi:hypothetical protein C7427_109176 [Pantoea ananatis]|nr:hypothetical protein C7427_109176 [Pantoea ananatis]
MRKKDITAALTSAMRKEGYELDGSDRLLIRKMVMDSLASQRRRENFQRSVINDFTWKRPLNPRTR